MTALLAARRKHLAASSGLHARTESVRLGAPASARLIGALWQSNPPLYSTDRSLANFRLHPHKPHPRLSANQLV
jgi:hypothetical protein